MKKFEIPVKSCGLNVEHYLYNKLLEEYPDWDESEIGCMKEYMEKNLIILVEPTDDSDEDYDKILNLITFWKKNKWRFDW